MSRASDTVATNDAYVVVVSGLPASGKSTVARQLGPILGLPSVDKDDILEALFPTDGAVDPVERSRLSREADWLMRLQIEASPRAVVASHWQRAQLSTASGTPTQWLDQFPVVIEVHCVCRPATAVKRFLQRKRHPSHGDHLRDPNEIRRQFDSVHQLGPLGIGHLVSVDTETQPEIERLAHRIDQAVPFC